MSGSLHALRLKVFLSPHPQLFLHQQLVVGREREIHQTWSYSSQEQRDSYFWVFQDIPWFVLNQWVVPSATQLHLHTLNSVANWRGCMNFANPVAISQAPQQAERLEGRKSFLNEKQTLILKLPSFTTFCECLNGHLCLCASWFTNCIKLRENLSPVGFCSPKCWLLKVHYLRSEGLERPALSIHFMYWH